MTLWTRMSRFAPLVLLACLAAGCETTEHFVRPRDPVPVAVRGKEAPPPAPAAGGSVHQVHAAWEGRIMETPDVANNGAPLLGLAGRLYLFGSEVGYPLVGDGAAVIELCDLAKLDSKGKPQLLERWEIDKVTLKKLLRKDMIGWGYTLFLPWSTYKPEIDKVQLQVRYVPDKGLPLFSPPAVVALRSDNQLTMTQRQSLPVSPPTAGVNAPPH